MNYPLITNINDVLPFTVGRQDFNQKVYDFPNNGGKYVSINYRTYGEPSAIFQMDDPKVSSILRELRGIKFCAKTGNILARPFHKFFNYNEVEETKTLDFNTYHEVFSKVDGSMIHPIFDENGKMYLCTKAGITEISMEAQKTLLKEKSGISYAIAHCEVNGWTPIFEYCSMFNRVVLSYPEPRLILLAVRKKKTGEYLPTHMIENLAKTYDLDLVERFSMFSPQAISELKTKENVEGVVIQFDGTFVKVKSDWYCLLHRGKESMAHEKNILKIILNESLDDLIPTLQDIDRKFIEAYVASFNKSFNRVVDFIENLLNETSEMQNRKDVALHVINAFNDFDHPYFVHVFWMIYEADRTRDDIAKSLAQFILKKCNCQKSVDSMRDFIGVDYKKIIEE